jgi:hypothetical protein
MEASLAAVEDALMDAVLESTRGFERSDPGWHGKLESADSAEEVVALLRDYIATLSPQHLVRLPGRLPRPPGEGGGRRRVLDVSPFAAPRHEDAAIDAELMQDVFNHFLHASLRISQIRRAAASTPERGH